MINWPEPRPGKGRIPFKERDLVGLEQCSRCVRCPSGVLCDPRCFFFRHRRASRGVWGKHSFIFVLSGVRDDIREG